jgi:hypothetical protein
MPAFSGSSLYVEWIHSGGTLVLTGEQRTFSYKPGVKLLDQTAGSDVADSFIKGTKNGNASIELVQQAGGSATFNALVEGAYGTLIWGEEGTATGKPKHTIAAYSMGPNVTHPYAGVSVLTCAFTQDGARTDGSY